MMQHTVTVIEDLIKTKYDPEKDMEIPYFTKRGIESKMTLNNTEGIIVKEMIKSDGTLYKNKFIMIIPQVGNFVVKGNHIKFTEKIRPQRLVVKGFKR